MRGRPLAPFVSSVCSSSFLHLPWSAPGSAQRYSHSKTSRFSEVVSEADFVAAGGPVVAIEEAGSDSGFEATIEPCVVYWPEHVDNVEIDAAGTAVAFAD